MRFMLGLAGVSLLMSICSARFVHAKNNIGSYAGNTNTRSTGAFDSDRSIRAIPPKLLSEGLKATQQILDGALRIRSKARFRRYEKIGNINTAVNDFYSVRPTKVTEFRQSQTVSVINGYVGDRKIMLKDPGIYGDPYIEIVDNKAKEILEKLDQAGQYADRVIYKKKYSDKYRW